MLRVFFTNDDLLRVTVAPAADPLWEVVLAGCRLRDRDPVFSDWRRRLGRCDPALRVLHVLTPPPDLLTPPESAGGLEKGLAALRRTPADRARAPCTR